MSHASGCSHWINQNSSGLVTLAAATVPESQTSARQLHNMRSLRHPRRIARTSAAVSSTSSVPGAKPVEMEPIETTNWFGNSACRGNDSDEVRPITRKPSTSPTVGSRFVIDHSASSPRLPGQCAMASYSAGSATANPAARPMPMSAPRIPVAPVCGEP